MLAVNNADRCLHQLIEDQAQRTPDQVAVVFEQQRLTYRELDRRAGQLAEYLRQLHVGPDSLVGLCVERSLEMVIGILGILKAGAAYVPMDATYPPERIAYMLGDAQVKILLTQQSLVAGLPSADAQVVCLDSFDWTQPLGPAAQSGAPVQPDNLAYVIYTSGSTGRPKGVCIEHRNIVSYVLGVSERLRLEPGMQHATVSTIAADLGNTVVFPALVTGGCLHVIAQERTESQALLSEYFVRERIDVLKIVPSHLAALQVGKNPELVMPRRRLILGGEASRRDWIEQLRVLAPDCEIYNHYGPTETTVGVLTYRVDRTVPDTKSGTLPLGKPLPNARVSILDGERRPVAAGELGELYIGGAGVARGYLNRPDLTAERFVSDTGDRLYRTGDLARALSDGSIEFCGRIDDQVKIHGYRIEPGEITSVLREHRGLREAVVLAREPEGGNGDKQLVAYVVPQRAEQPLWSAPSVHVLPDGMAVAHLNKSETDYIYNEIFVLQAYLRHGITIQDGDCVVDAGANIGLFTVFASRLAPNVRIHAFEPNPTVFACLQANAAAYGGAAGVTCHPVGLSRDNRSGDLTFFEGMSLLSGLYADPATERDVVKSYVRNQQDDGAGSERWSSEIGALIDERLQSQSVTVQLRTLSDVIADEAIERIDLLKINVEKSELDVLLGLGHADWPKVRQLVIEVDLRSNLEPITSLLEQQGFEVLVEQDPLLRSTDLCYVYAVRPSAGRRLIREQPADAHIHRLPAVDDVILTPTTLRKYVGARLPHYMVPAAFLLLESLPLNANGKIDRQALPLVAADETRAARGTVAPRTDTERALAALWAELLNVPSVGVNDDFFEMGGHSLLAIKVVSRVRDVFGVDFPLRNLFDRSTVATMAEAIDALGWMSGGRARSTPRPSGAGDREEIAV
ncbi:MAG TPA: amino acid adenylation domain-containing protein [Gemmatimonadales bacterium]